MKILLVDDDPFFLKLLTFQLTNLGFREVLPYQRAADALDHLRRNASSSVELVILDLQMPEMDGVEFMRHLTMAGYVGAVLLISGEDERILYAATHLARVHRLRVLGALRKPTTAEQLWIVLSESRKAAEDRSGTDQQEYSVEDVRHAIAAGELVNYYQPKVELNSGDVVGVETLIRWNHPSDGLVRPDRFVGIAEDDEAIHELTRYVLMRALNDAERWHAMKQSFSIAVNVSMENLNRLDFPDWISTAARNASVPASNIVLEVTESRLMREPSAALDILARLRLKHVGLSIDDFGTGYASLAQLRDIPFDELKVDQGFVHDAHADTALRAILEASLSMAEQLGIRTVAEGVENLADWNFLLDQKCEVAQGYFIGEPMPVEELPEWMSEWEKRYAGLPVGGLRSK